MDWSLVLTLILGSSVMAALVTKIFDLLTVRQRKSEEQYQKLYGPLKLYLMMLNLNEENKKQIFEHFHQTRKEWTENKDGHTQGEIVMGITRKRSEVINPLVKQWWLYIEKIRHLLENTPQYIKKQDFPIFKKFMDAYIKRDIIGKDDGGNDTLVYLPEEKSKDYMDSILNIVIEMQNKFLL